MWTIQKYERIIGLFAVMQQFFVISISASCAFVSSSNAGFCAAAYLPSGITIMRREQRDHARKSRRNPLFAHQEKSTQHEQQYHGQHLSSFISRRQLLNAVGTTAGIVFSTSHNQWASAAEAEIINLDARNTDNGVAGTMLESVATKVVTLRLNSPNDKAGIELSDVIIRSSSNNNNDNDNTSGSTKLLLPPRSGVVIKRVVSSTPQNAQLEAGMILLDYQDSKSVVNRIRNGPYPIDLKFYAFQKQETPMQTPQPTSSPTTSSMTSAASPTQDQQPEPVYQKLITEFPSSKTCTIQAQKGDVIEMNYEAYMVFPGEKLVMYDSSFQRGTGLPYQMVLGSYDMIPGVDQGLGNVQPGTKLILNIPSSLAYGTRGSRLFQIPGNTNLRWEIEVVAINQFRCDGSQNDDI